MGSSALRIFALPSNRSAGQTKIFRRVPTSIPHCPWRDHRNERCKLLKGLAPQVGLEPTTLRLTAECSAIELLRSVAAGLRASPSISNQWDSVKNSALLGIVHLEQASTCFDAPFNQPPDRS